MKINLSNLKNLKKISGIFLSGMVTFSMLSIGSLSSIIFADPEPDAHNITNANPSGNYFSSGKKDQRDPNADPEVTGHGAGTPVTVNIRKDIDVYNHGYTALADNEVTPLKIYMPNVTYTYAIEPVTVTSATVKDNDSPTAHQTAVKSGVNGGVVAGTTITSPPATTSISFTNDDYVNMVAGDSGKVHASKYFSVTIDPSQFKDSNNVLSAGIYRYKITETVAAGNSTTGNEALTNASLTRPTGYATTRYLDVYLKNTSTGPLEVYGYVLFIGTDNASIDGTAGTYGPTGKTNGFVDEYYTKQDNTTGTAEIYADQYHTYNLKIRNEITGGLADLSNKFGYTIETSSQEGQTNYVTTIYDEDGSGSVSSRQTPDRTSGLQLGTGTPFTTASLGDNSTGANSDGGYIILIGLPANATFNVKETNTTSDTYNVTVTGTIAPVEANPSADPPVEANPGDGAAISGTLTASGDTQTFSLKDAKLAVSPYSNSSTQKTNLDSGANYTEIIITNTLEAVSPTGVFMRVAPYILLLALVIGVGVIFVIRNNKQKSDKKQESKKIKK